MLVRTEREKALDDDVCVCVHHVVRVEAKLPVFQVLVVGRAVYLLQHVREVIQRQFEEELVAFHEHAARDEEEVDAVDGSLLVGVVVLHAVAAVLEIGVGVLVLAQEADGEVLVRVGGVLAEGFEGRAEFEHEQRVELDDREHEEGEGRYVFLHGSARRRLVPDCVVVSDETVRHGVGEMLGRKVDVVLGQRQFAVPGFCIGVCRCDRV